MTALVLTPFTGGQAVELGNRTWLKKVLPVGEVAYKGRTLQFTRDYLGRLVEAFRARAYDQVPFQLADHANLHTNDPERTGGWVTDMELRDDGLYVTAEVNPKGEAVLTANPELGISARIVEDYDRSDGQFFPAAIQHVLGTLDPRIPGLGGWQAIEASSPVPDTVIDLSASSFAGEAPAAYPDAPPSGRTGTGMNLNAAQQARLEQLLSLPDDQFAALTGGPGAPGDDLGAGPAYEDDLSDADLDDLIAAAEALDSAGLLDEGEGPGFTPNYMPAGEPVAAGLSHEAQFAIDLANARAEENARELAVVTARLREEDYQAERRRLADLGVPGYITDLAKPLLQGAGHSVELANGRTVDAGAIMRRVLSEYAAQARLLDLGAELGSPMDEPEDEAAEAQAGSREELVSRIKAVTGLR